MIAIDNTHLKNYCKKCNCTAFTPTLAFEFTNSSSVHTVELTDSSTIDSGDELSIINITITDKNGKEVNGVIDTSNADVTINVATLDLSGPLNITATIVTKGGCVATGSAFDIKAAGTVGSWNKTTNASSGIEPLDPEPVPDDPIPVDNSALVTEINTAINLNEGDYTAPTWANLIVALTDAIAVVADSSSTQTAVDDALLDLQNAIAALAV